MAYFPSVPPVTTEVGELLAWVQLEFEVIARTLNEQTEVELRPIFAAPKKPREGMIVFADGTSWNPGTGKGAYVYKSGLWSML